MIFFSLISLSCTSLCQEPYFDVNLVNRGPARSDAEKKQNKSSSKEVDQKSAVGLNKDRLMIRLGNSAWIEGGEKRQI